MKLSGGAGFAVGCVFSLTVAGGTVAYAANGGALTLGKANKATATTSLANSAGTALSLSSKAGTPALKVGNGVKVPNLNADKIDGLDSSVFAKASGSTGYVTASGQSVDVNNDNVPDVIFAGAVCPSGSKVVGGGSDNFTGNGLTFADAPGVTEGGPRGSWLALSTLSTTGDATADDPSNVHVYALCYNPKGAVSGATAALRPRLSVAQKQLIATRLAHVQSTH